jgi:hypothetical protein
MIKKQIRNNNIACLASELIGGFPPYQFVGGIPIREHSICEVMDDDTLKVVALYKLHSSQWYRYDLISVFPPYPPQPQPLNVSISKGLIVPDIPVIPDSTGGLYQQWDNHPDSPVLTSNFKYQFIMIHNLIKYLYVSNGIYAQRFSGSLTLAPVFPNPTQGYTLNNGVWVRTDALVIQGWEVNYVGTILESNENIYNTYGSNYLTSGVHFARTKESNAPNPTTKIVSVSPTAINKSATTPTIPTIESEVV